MRLGKVAEIGAEQGRIELIGIAEASGEIVSRTIGDGEAVTLGGGDRDRIVADRPCASFRREPQPVMVEADIVEWSAERPERMDIAVADRAEIAEIDSQFEGRMRGAHEVRLVEAQAFDEGTDVRQGRLADADDADVRRLDQLHGAGIRQQAHQRRGGHPTRRPAADHYDPRWRRPNHLYHPLFATVFLPVCGRAVSSLLHFGNTSATYGVSVYQIMLFDLSSQK